MDDIFHELPKADPFFDFSWRIRIDVRSAIDMPLNRINSSGLPTSFVGIFFYVRIQFTNYFLFIRGWMDDV